MRPGIPVPPPQASTRPSESGLLNSVLSPLGHEWQRSKPKSGSLDSDILLGRRLIQNCFPHLEDILVLLETFDRTWKLGLGHSSESGASRTTRSPYLARSVGVSPRGRRVIKPHPLRTLSRMPSVPEDRQGGTDSTSRGGRDVSGYHKQNARVRLVEAFFHAQPAELQTTADFIVRRTVDNTCEAVLSGVIRPAYRACLDQLKEETGTATKNRSSEHLEEAASSSAGVSDALHGSCLHLHGGSLERQMVYLTAKLERKVSVSAKHYGGTTARDLAGVCTRLLAPQHLPLR